MDQTLFIATIEAQFVMGHCAPCAHVSMDRRTVETYSWDVDVVRQALHVPLDDLWEERVLAIEHAGLTSLSSLSGLGPSSEHAPRESWAELSIQPHGVLQLAALYGRAIVRHADSPAVLQHWRLVQAEAAARLAQPLDEARFAREFPERHRQWKAWEAEYWASRDETDPEDE